MTRIVFGPPKSRPTRYAGLGYRMDAPGLWRFVDTSDNFQATIGPQYKTKIELLCDLENFAKARGYDN